MIVASDIIGVKVSFYMQFRCSRLNIPQFQVRFTWANKVASTCSNLGSVQSDCVRISANKACFICSCKRRLTVSKSADSKFLNHVINVPAGGFWGPKIVRVFGRVCRFDLCKARFRASKFVVHWRTLCGLETDIETLHWQKSRSGDQFVLKTCLCIAFLFCI